MIFYIRIRWAVSDRKARRKRRCLLCRAERMGHAAQSRYDFYSAMADRICLSVFFISWRYHAARTVRRGKI